MNIPVINTMKNFYACQPFQLQLRSGSKPSVGAGCERARTAVRQELKDILAFWYGKGVDGFRVDMASSLVKNDKGQRRSSISGDRETWSDKNFRDHVLMAEWGSRNIASRPATTWIWTSTRGRTTAGCTSTKASG